MKQVIAFRADASLQIGTGHVMRCLTLADVLKAQGAECQFICREHPGHLIEHIRSKGYTVHALPASLTERVSSPAISVQSTAPRLAHADWLGATQEQDAAECASILGKLQSDWLIVDHYALDANWQKALKPYYDHLMVIDDLADRQHQCDLLLDQTFGRNPQAYKPWVPADCTLLCGSQYALLRPEFAALRTYSLQRRESPKLEHLLITMGGVDKDNATGQVLQALESSELPANCQITVVMGATAPWLAEVRQQAQRMLWPTTVLEGVSNMAQLMADSDLAIGAAGATSWERCCMGLPTAMVVLADNQMHAATLLDQAQAVRMLSLGESLAAELAWVIEDLEHEKQLFKDIITHAKGITDGTGGLIVAGMLEKLSI